MKPILQKYSTFPAFLFALLLLPCIAFGDDLFTRTDPVNYTKYQKVSPGQTVGGYPILNLGSPLVIMDLKSAPVGGMEGESPLSVGLAALADARENRLFAAVWVEANLSENGRLADWTDEPCRADDFLWKRSTGGAFNNINCVTISPLLHFAPDYPTVIGVKFTRYTTSGRRLSYIVGVNPEFFNIARDAESDPKLNSWNKERYGSDSAKVRFLAGLEKWATDVQDRMDKALGKDPEAFSDMASFVSYFL